MTTQRPQSNDSETPDSKPSSKASFITSIVTVILGIPAIVFVMWGVYLVTIPLHRGIYRDNTNGFYVLFGLIVLGVGLMFAAFAIWVGRSAGDTNH